MSVEVSVLVKDLFWCRWSTSILPWQAHTSCVGACTLVEKVCNAGVACLQAIRWAALDAVPFKDVMAYFAG